MERQKCLTFFGQCGVHNTFLFFIMLNGILPLVKQGTIMGPILCIVETDKINKNGEMCYTTYGPEKRINHLLYVDDIVGVGSPMVIQNTVKNIKLLSYIA